MWNYLAVAAGGAVGALLRSFVYLTFARYANPTSFMLPTLTVNVVGSFVLGVSWYFLVVKAMLPPLWKDFVTVGFLGALTTFSTFSLDIFRLYESDRAIEATAYMVGSVLSCVLATGLGIAIARLMCRV